jgi:hypothetical protein
MATSALKAIRINELLALRSKLTRAMCSSVAARRRNLIFFFPPKSSRCLLGGGGAGSGQEIGAIFLFWRESYFFEALKAQKKLTDSEQRELFY